MTEDKDNESGYDGKGLKGALWTLAGTAIGQLASSSGLLGGVFGRPPFPPPGGPAPFVTREVLDLTTENQGLKSQLYTNELDKRQSVWNATQQGRIDCMQRQIDQLFGLTQLTVPNANLNPGYGPAVVGPAPTLAVPPAVEAANSSIASTIASAVATAVVSAMKDAA